MPLRVQHWRRATLVLAALLTGLVTVPAVATSETPSRHAAPSATSATSAPTVPVPTASPGAPVGESVAAEASSGGTGNSGEGLLALTMDAPGTDWADPRNTSVVVAAQVDDGQPQTIVLFDGARPRRYTGFTGPLSVGQHTVTITVRPDLSATTITPVVQVRSISLTVVRTGDPDYLPLAYAPVLYERNDVATSDTPLLSYAAQRTLADGSHRLDYTTVWSNEDGGTGLVPADLWGGYGRITDIETYAHLVVAPDGRVRSATYLACSRCPVSFPEQLTALDETVVPFTGQYVGHHPVLRVATANNDMVQTGTRPYRMQLVPLGAPPRGAVREAVMDAHPWTYRIMDKENRREHALGGSSDPRLPLPGQAPQYAIIDISADLGTAESADVEVRLTGDPTWYASDYSALLPLAQQGFPTYPFYPGGHRRTAVKLPVDWHSHGVDGLRLRLDYAPGVPPSGNAVVHSLRMLELTTSYTVRDIALPPVQVVTGTGLPGALAP